MKQTIFEKYGGFAKVNRVVMAFYDKILDSPITAPFFAGSDMRRLIDHQTKFIASVMGGPASYTSDHLERVHKHLGITEQAFFESVDLLKETLEDQNFSGEDVRTIEDCILEYKNFIISRG
jgi:hemoglobin